MAGLGVRRSRRMVTATAVLAVLGALAYGPAAAADAQGTGRLHTITFNACDQYLTGKVPCTDNTPHDRAIYIENIMLAADFLPQVGTFQEMCYSTYTEIKTLLGTSWNGDFEGTRSALYTRCGGDGRWGVAYLIRASVVLEETLELPDDPAERRVVLCGKTTIYSGFRVCTTHLTPIGSNPSVNQVNALGGFMKNWAFPTGAAVIVGGDMNLNALWPYCDANGPNPVEYVNRLKPLYYSNFGQANKQCGPGTNYYYEADNDRDLAGDGIYDESTIAGESRKLDYIFFNYQRFNSDYGGDARAASGLSDHVYLRASMTVHD